MNAPDQAKFSGLAAVLAKNLSEIPDLPNYIAPPPGVYKLMITACGQKIINEKTVIVTDYTFLEIKELNSKADDEDRKDVAKIQWGKDRMSESFYFDDPDRIEQTLGVLKKKYGHLGQIFGTTNLLEILEKLPNLTIEAQIGRRGDEKDSTKFYPYTRTIVAAV
jgi:hypothetical protein